MNDEIEKLKRGYRQIEAPPFLLTRIRAQVDAHSPRSWYRAGVVTALAVVVGIAVILPIAMRQTAVIEPRYASVTPPSIGSITAMKIEKPTGVSLSLSQLRSVSLPPPPQKPAPDEGDAQTYFDSYENLPEEKDHVHS